MNDEKERDQSDRKDDRLCNHTHLNLIQANHQLTVAAVFGLIQSYQMTLVLWPYLQ
jgi:hypothetical protein